MPTLNRQLIDDLSQILRQPALIYVDSIEPERDRLPVPRGLLEVIAEAFDLAERRIVTLTGLAQELSRCLNDLLAACPELAADPRVRQARLALQTLSELRHV